MLQDFIVQESITSPYN